MKFFEILAMFSEVFREVIGKTLTKRDPMFILIEYK
jgi:hypothetical protein